MKLSEIGEFGLIDRIAKNTIQDATTVLCGIGDDAAVLKPVAGMVLLATADMLVEDVHFRLDTITPWQLGFKSLAVNISDIAAMGGIPRHALVCLGLPRTVAVAFVEQFYEGLKHLAALQKVNIVGGDTVSSPGGLIINVTLLGETEQDRAIYRSGALLGDAVVVSGTLGDSAAGLLLLLNKAVFANGERLLSAHLTPEPQVALGRVCSSCHVHAMNDISDGLASELHEICKASGLGARIYEAALPLSDSLTALADKLGTSAVDYALYGGEDYQLVFTATRQQLAEVSRLMPEIKLTVVGQITEPQTGLILVKQNGQEEPLQPKGYNHFTGGNDA
jgi:thiamine-monophosphate kinase